MVGEACLPSNAYYPRTPDYILYSGVHVCWSEHSDSSFVYGFMSLDYGLGTMTAITYHLLHMVTGSTPSFLPNLLKWFLRNFYHVIESYYDDYDDDYEFRFNDLLIYEGHLRHSSVFLVLKRLKR